MFYRNIISELNKWAKQAKRKPLVLRGARQVGKTTVVKYFSQSFNRFIYFNLERKDHREIFETDQPFEELLNAIYYYSEHIRDNSKTLIFIDEIQNSPKAVASLRYFFEEAPNSAGSLLESLIDRHISFPVGRVEYMTVRPCSFNEFLLATGEKNSIQLINQLNIPLYAHNKLKELFNRYALIGGMPEIIAMYTESRDLVSLNTIYDGLLASYRDDVEKYAHNNTQVQHIRHILKSGLSFAEQRIKFENFGSSNYRSREMGEAFRTLEKAMLLELVYPLTQPTLPAIPDLKKSPRLHWLDTGLVNYSSGVQKEVFGSTDIQNAWRGIIAEHITGQEILSLEYSVLATRKFWVREAKNSSAEIDFLVLFEGMLIPVEVKSGEGSHLKSLHIFMNAAPHSLAIRIWSEPTSIHNVTTDSGKIFKLINLPFYLIGKIPEILKENI